MITKQGGIENNVGSGTSAQADFFIYFFFLLLLHGFSGPSSHIGCTHVWLKHTSVSKHHPVMECEAPAACWFQGNDQ